MPCRSDLKQRREITAGDTVFVDQAPVRAALHGRILLLEGVERAERNVLPTLNNLLEVRRRCATAVAAARGLGRSERVDAHGGSMAIRSCSYNVTAAGAGTGDGA